jgi:hypothetical protein
VESDVSTAAAVLFALGVVLVVLVIVAVVLARRR